MKRNQLVRAAASAALIGLALPVAFGIVPNTASMHNIQRGGLALNTFGVYFLGETNPTTTSSLIATNPTRDAGNFCASPNKVNVLGGAQFYVGGISDGYFDNTTPVAGKVDFLGYQILENPQNYGTISYYTVDAAYAAGGGGSNIGQFAIGGIANNGLTALRLGTGGGNTYGIGTSSLAVNLVTPVLPTTVQFGTSYTTPTAGTNYTNLYSGNSSSLKPQVPTIAYTSLFTLDTTFNKEIVGAGGGITGPYSPNYSPSGKVLAAVGSSEDNRGSVVYNENAGIAAVYRWTPAHGYVTGVAVYKVIVSGTGDVTLQDLAGNPTTNGTYLAFPTAVKTVGGVSYDLVGTNYFSTSPYVGPAQVSINDNGDIAVLTVAANVAVANDNQARGAQDKRYLVATNLGSSYSSWAVAAQSGTNTTTTTTGLVAVTPGTGNFATLNPLDDPANPLNSVAASAPSIDNDGNVYFTAATEIDAYTGTTSYSTVHTAVFRAVPGVGSYTVDKVLAEGDWIVDPVTTNAQVVTFIPLSIATSVLSNSNIRYAAANSLSPNAAIKDSLGGLAFACKVSDPRDLDPDNLTYPTRWNFMYIAYK